LGVSGAGKGGEGGDEEGGTKTDHCREAGRGGA
jgi:hypothetical protein